MELLSQQNGFVSAGCEPCHFSLSVPLDVWKAGKAERDTSFVPPTPAAPE
jgi:hypothetical protein